MKTDGSTQAKFGIVMVYDYTYTLCETLRVCLTSFTQPEYVLLCVCVCVCRSRVCAVGMLMLHFCFALAVTCIFTGSGDVLRKNVSSPLNSL